MHEIICQASQSEVDKNNREEELERAVRDMEEELKEVKNGKKFIERHGLAKDSYNKFKMWSGKLETLIFQN